MKLTKKKALKLMAEVVKEQGKDTTVSHCVYFVDNAPVCLVGHVFAKLGVGQDDLAISPVAWSQDGDANGREIEDITVRGVEITPNADRVLSIAQEAQDMGDTWGKALTKARRGGKSL